MESTDHHTFLQSFGLVALIYMAVRVVSEATFWYAVHRAKGELLLEDAAKAKAKDQ